MRRIALVLALLGSLFSVTDAEAKMFFGKDETIHFIQDVPLKFKADEALFLAHMTRIQFFVAGLYVEDAGYVLGIKGDSKYYHLPTGDQLAQLQRNGSLPNPLPPYSLGFFDYLFGYSLWVLIAFVVGGVVFDARRKKRKAAEALPPAAPPVAR